MREAIRGWSAEALRTRLAVGLTLEDLAGLAGCSASAIRHWEIGEYGPQPRLAVALSAALGVALDDLVTVARDNRLLRDLRTWAGFTQREVQDALTLRELGPMERGARPVPSDAAPALAETYGVSVAELHAAAARTRENWRDRVAGEH